VCTNEIFSAALIAVTCTVSPLKRRHYPAFCDEWVGVEISTSDGLTLPSVSIAEIIYIFFNMLDIKNNRVMEIGDFNTPGFDRERSLSLDNCHFYCKALRFAIYTSSCILDLDALQGSNLSCRLC
jgi:hypothetical protein